MTARKIIVGYDRSSDSMAAVRWALGEATRTGALVEFLFAYEWPTWAPSTTVLPMAAVWPDGEADRAIKGMMHEAVRSAEQTHPAVRTDSVVVIDGAARTLIDRSAGAGLIVLGSRGHSGVTGLLGSVSVAVSAHARCPVVVVRGDPGACAPIVAGVDESPSASAVLGFAVEQAAAHGVPLRVVRAWAPVPGMRPESPVITRPITPAQRQPFDDLVAEWQEKYPEVAISAEAVAGHPAGVLTEASAGAQLLVIGTRGHGAVRGRLLGSVSQHLLRHSARSVAVVHEAAPA
jgi:nucleotide-binding universal stress UspA family protein